MLSSGSFVSWHYHALRLIFEPLDQSCGVSFTCGLVFRSSTSHGCIVMISPLPPPPLPPSIRRSNRSIRKWSEDVPIKQDVQQVQLKSLASKSSTSIISGMVCCRHLLISSWRLRRWSEQWKVVGEFESALIMRFFSYTASTHVACSFFQLSVLFFLEHPFSHASSSHLSSSSFSFF